MNNMMEDEFLESDIIFPECPPPRLNQEMISYSWNNNNKSKRKMMMMMMDKDDEVVDDCPVPVKIQGKSSFPVTIPAAPNKLGPAPLVEPPETVLKDVEGEVVVVPPHLIIRRRLVSARKMAFSVCTGNGRTLKGRDLSQVRNMILRMTGFLET
ncbi:uncharacterized protein LOC124913644 [Impatiens glandulifera]|uniref:uncharacterized protein LOC124913644 n=1 Tax=Impatiens glandulifera TaxID=253017 RepID=UPI001FB136CC|nr:uncharacterized protein LOC124913644 [Impatiens glandulifera]